MLQLRFEMKPNCYAKLYPYSPMFPSNSALIDRASKFSIFAMERKSVPVKQEPVESDSHRNSSPGMSDSVVPSSDHKSSKRKEREKKVKGPSKKSKNAENDKEKIPYVHVRARRGQATDSHSLAERARREKINARMKLLQELVPGCNMISGTVMVLDEIINHVQSLQCQVENSVIDAPEAPVVASPAAVDAADANQAKTTPSGASTTSAAPSVTAQPANPSPAAPSPAPDVSLFGTEIVEFGTTLQKDTGKKFVYTADS